MMTEHSLKPLSLKSLTKTASGVPFPYGELSKTDPQPQPQVKETDRLHQLEEMLLENQAHSVEIEREAYDKAYAAGEKTGLALGQKRAEQILAQMQQMLDASESQLDEVRRSMCEAVVDISGTISEWLIGEMVEQDRARLLEMAKKTAHALPEMNTLTLAVHPDDYNRFEKLLAESKTPSPLIADANITPSTIRIFSKTQDALIDPRTSIAEGVAYIKAELLSDDPIKNA
jgi:flagellar assembly protein FliH